MAFKDNPIIFLTRYAWKYGDRKKIILFVFLFLCANAVNFFQPLLIGYIFNIIQQEGINSGNIMRLLSLLFCSTLLVLGFWIFHGPARVIERKNAFITRVNFRKYLFDGVLNLPAEWHSNHHSGNTIDKVNKSSSGLFDFCATTFEVIEASISFVASFAALIYFNIYSTVIVTLSMAITMVIIFRFDSKLVPQSRELNTIENQISGKVFDFVSNITTIIILRIQNLVSSSLLKKTMEPFRKFSRQIKLTEWKWFSVSFIGALMTFGVLGSYIYMIYKSGETILLGNIFILNGYLQRVYNVFSRFTSKYNQLVKQKTDVQNVEDVTAEFENIKEKQQTALDNRWNNLEVKSLNFTYEQKERLLHLNNINMTIKRGQRIALIGESGSGKSTMLKILIDLYTPKSMSLSLDGVALKDGFKKISESITLVPQDPELFNDTILYNITIGAKYPLNVVRKFTDIACFTQVAERLPNKYDSSIKEKGVNLSGGEKQRLALSRGLLAFKGKEILLLDEPTSSVDSKTEMKIFKNIFREFENKTIISSVHRLHLLPMFDKIYFFDNGKIIASGSLNELLKNQQFKVLWDRYNKLLKKENAERSEFE